MRFSIGEFSLTTSLSIKSLRLYHEKGLLIPAEVDADSGYRYYDESNFETGKSIKMLKGFGFSLAEIKDFLDQCSDESDLLPQLEQKLGQVKDQIDRYNYDEVGKGLGLVCKKMGRHVNGKPMTLYYDDEYKDEDADFEPCVPVRKGQDTDGISVRELKGGRCVTLVHQGPYETLRESYKRLFAYANEKGYTIRRPTREVYRKGPGLIFKGNPKNYLTEIQLPIED